jgi:hypothetical protein
MDINIWSVIVATVVAFIIGAIWYSPVLFGKEWMALSGCTDKDMNDAKKKGVFKFYIIQLITTLVTFVVLGFAMSFAGVDTTSDGALIGIIAWLGFILPGHIGSLMWERRPVKLVLINTVCSLLTLVVGGAIIGAW